MNEIAATIPSKWRDVGVQLGVDHSVLEGIATTTPNDTNQCYTRVFTQWKNQNSVAHPFIWATVVEVLQAPSVGEQRLADKIKNDLIGHPSQ